MVYRSCSGEPHVPMSCEDWQKWLGHVQEMSSQMGDRTATQLDDAASQRWLATRSKPCPKCRSGHTHTRTHAHNTHTHTHMHTHTQNVLRQMHTQPSTHTDAHAPTNTYKVHTYYYISTHTHTHTQAHTDTRVCVCLMYVRAPIEKNDGCNHMCCKKVSVLVLHTVCTTAHTHIFTYIQQPTLHYVYMHTHTHICTYMHKCPQCKHDFCWVCLDEWKQHNTSTGGYFE